MAYKLSHAHSWIIDSGATEHITCSDINLFNIVSLVPESSVKIPNGESVLVHAVGSLYLLNGLRLERVLYIPKFQCNLLSASRLTSDLNCALIFFSDFCVFQDLSSRKLIGGGKFRDGLYYLECSRSEGVAMSVSITSDLWHQRLGHASDGKIHHISSLKGFQRTNNFCDPCIRAKQTRLPFPTSTIKTTRCFELIHCDIWGPYRCDSISGARYFLSIVDDFTRGVWVYLMKNKSEVSQLLIQFCNMIYTQFEQKVKRVRADNGVEFQTNNLIDYYGRTGILLETSCTDTPQQNGVVERKHRHILEIARALRFQSGLPIDFWGECILTAVYIINRLPSPVIFNKSPFEMLFGKLPNYDHLRVFGCLVYAHDNKRKDKFSERGSPCIFIGYPYGQKAYRVFDLQKQSVYSSRDVTFFEDNFPFKSVENKEMDFGILIDRVYQQLLNQNSTANSPPSCDSFYRSGSNTEAQPFIQREGPAVVRKESRSTGTHASEFFLDAHSSSAQLPDQERITGPTTMNADKNNIIQNGSLPGVVSVDTSGRNERVISRSPMSIGDLPGDSINVLGGSSQVEHHQQAGTGGPTQECMDERTYLDGSLHPTFQTEGSSHVQSPVNGSNNITVPQNEPKRGERIRRRPKHLQDYETDLPPSLDHSQTTDQSAHSMVYPISNFISYDKFTPTHKAYLAAITSRDEPKNFKQAVQDPLWRAAMQKEITALEENKTWTLVELPPGKRVVDSKWVYKIKYKPNGDIERYKARLVARGFTQVEGIDFHDTFAPVAKLVTVRCLLAIAAKRNWIVHQLDVNNAFLHGDLSEDVYMCIPQGFLKSGDTRVCKLQKSLYGLRQASRNWHQKFTQALHGIGFRQSRADHSLFIFQQGPITTFALIYVDDVILAGNNAPHISTVKGYLDTQFSIKDLGKLKYFLGIEVARSPDSFILSQRKYTLDILEESGFLAGRPCSFPMEQNLKLRPDDNSPLVDVSSYRRLIGRLLYLTVTRPDIVYSVSQLSQFLSNPRQTHLDAATRVLRYLKQTPGQGIFLSSDPDFGLKGYCDSDWAGCPFTRRSSTGYFITIGTSPVSWRTKKQSVVSRSSAEAEYRAMAITISEILWLRWLLRDLTINHTGPTPLYCDNQAARHIALNPVFHERTKHVEMDCYFVRERVASKEIQPYSIHTDNQVADIFTKALGADRFQFLRSKLGVCDLHTPP
ncbi:unnamed protein product [Cuscuta epithymum]|uniref:Integrase catalytic domain-containing protein n=1 Tax=Cuscuta epithymum TaxID=186058 RepID=A0AAV0D1T9_9ASTE|nr:unnamed protein product [Cuscuta epithymum]